MRSEARTLTSGRHRRSRRARGAIVAAIGLAWCSACSSAAGRPAQRDQADPASSPVVTVTVTAGPSPTTSTSTTSSPTVTPKPVTTTRVDGYTLFSTPTGNIGCEMEPDYVRCEASQHSWDVGPQPASCDLSWSSSVVLGSRAEAGYCAGDTVLGSANILAYGKALQVGPMVCVSQQAGMRCENRDTKHGFTVSRESYQLF